MRFHILNGDALKEKFPYGKMYGEVIVIREAFIDGPVSNVYDATFWSKRKDYIEQAYGDSAEIYDDHVMSEFIRLRKIASADEVYLWFEDDLFCQSNMWFAVDFISKQSQPQFYRVFPKEDALHWKGFGFAGKKELILYFNQAIALSREDLLHLRKLWKAYVESDNAELEALSEIKCSGIRFQKEVIQVQVERTPDSSGLSRPLRTLSDLLKDGQLSFYQLYEKFSQREGIYGFGDAQVLNMLKTI